MLWRGTSPSPAGWPLWFGKQAVIPTGCKSRDLQSRACISPLLFAWGCWGFPFGAGGAPLTKKLSRLGKFMQNYKKLPNLPNPMAMIVVKSLSCVVFFLSPTVGTASPPAIFPFCLIFFPFCLKDFIILGIFFVTKFVTRITNFVTCVSKFVTSVTNFVTKNICAESKKYLRRK